MKRHVLTLVGVLSLLATAGAAFAQNGVIRVNVPFKFQVNRSALPAGEYSLSPIGGSSQVLLIRGTDKSIMASNANAVESGRPSDRTKLVFRCYGDRYFGDLDRGTRSRTPVSEEFSGVRSGFGHPGTRRDSVRLAALKSTAARSISLRLGPWGAFSKAPPLYFV